MPGAKILTPQSGAGFVLASGSPRRRQLLMQAGLQFDIVESGVDEQLVPGEPAPDYAQRLAGEKALAVSLQQGPALVLGADTVVAIDGEILGKPEHPQDARAMLHKLSARTHRVYTGFALARGGRLLDSACIVSEVTFRKLSRADIEAYIATSEPYDKAGAYAIQGEGAKFIARVDGSTANVMGLPIDEVLQALRRHGLP